MENDTYWNTGGPKLYSEDDLTSAIEADIISTETAILLRQHVVGLQNIPVADEEHFRLISGFNDIFVVIASVLLLVAVGGICGAGSTAVGAVAVAGTSWGLAEYFVRKRRMALPAIILLLAFAGGVFTAVMALLESSGGKSFDTMAACAVTVLASALHWKRFRVPITVACGMASAIALFVVLLMTVFPKAQDYPAVVSFLGGIAAFTLAMKWDASDTLRQTRQSDVAFWLHLLAAPLLVHPVFISIGIFEDGDGTLMQSLAVVLLYVVIAFISLCIDRRALMVSSLGYVIYAFSALFKNYGAVSRDFMVAALVIGAALLLLSAGWQAVRSRALKSFPYSIRKRLPPDRVVLK